MYGIRPDIIFSIRTNGYPVSGLADIRCCMTAGSLKKDDFVTDVPDIIFSIRTNGYPVSNQMILGQIMCINFFYNGSGSDALMLGTRYADHDQGGAEEVGGGER